MAWSVKMPVGLCVVLRLAICCWECRWQWCDQEWSVRSWPGVYDR